MSILPINFGCWLILQVLLVYWMLLVTECLCVARLLHMVIARENLGERVLHFHLTVKGTSHVPFWAERTVFLHESSCWRLLVVVTIVWQLGFPIVLEAQKSCRLLIHTPLLAEVMHNILVLFTTVFCIINILGDERAWSILDIAG